MPSFFALIFALVIRTVRHTGCLRVASVCFVEFTKSLDYDERNQDFRESGVRKDKDGE